MYLWERWNDVILKKFGAHLFSSLSLLFMIPFFQGEILGSQVACGILLPEESSGNQESVFNENENF